MASRSWVMSETDVGAVEELERIQREKIEISRGLRELEKLDSTTSEMMCGFGP